MIKKIAPVQAVTLLFLISLVILALVFHNRIPLWRDLLLNYFILLGLLFVFKLCSEQKVMGRAGMFLYRFSPIVFVISIYESLGDLIQHLQPDIDHELFKIDLFLFGVEPSLWIQKWIVPWLTDLLSLAYLSYYFIPVVLIAVLYLKNRVAEFNRAMFILALGYYASFIGYILFPAVGPRYAFTHLFTVPLEGSFITIFVRDTLNSLEHNIRDCMPSGHTQIVLMVLLLAYRYEKLLFYIFLPVICGLILSTVYLRYHYVIDLLVGGGLAIACTLIGHRLYGWWTRRISPEP